jgi:hypothetical protein|nr:MAG: hypothetical protein DIU62_08250 [Pseudomonadota bacterium]
MTGPTRSPRMPVMKPPFAFVRRLTLAVLLACLALPARPQQPPGYTIEIIVFRNGGDSGAMAPNEPRPVITGDDVVPQPGTSNKLGGAAARLNRNGLTVIGQAAWRQDPSAWNSRRGVSTARLGIPGVTGKVFFERGQYLHLGVDIVVEAGGRTYRLNEVRRVKADEIHYFDHPAVGVLAVVTGG